MRRLNLLGLGALWFAAIAIASLAFSAPAAAQTGSIQPNMVMLPYSHLTFRVSPEPAARPQSVPEHPLAVSGLIVPAQSLSCTPPAAPNELVELARALRWNPDLIYEYVHNTITTLPIYDSMKGPLGTLIDGAGTPADQAELMFVLLQQSCYSPQYEVGAINLTVAQLTKWLGTDNLCYSVAVVLIQAGFNPGVYGNCPTGTNGPATSVDVSWIWIAVPIGGTTYQFDPAGKIFTGSDGYQPRAPGIANLGSTALQYSQSSFLADAEAGATGIGTPAISRLNRTNVRADITAYANHLIGYIKANNPTATTADVIGGVAIDPLPAYTPPTSGPTRWGQTSLPYLNHQHTAPVPTANLNAVRTTLTLTLGSDDASGAFTPLASPTTFNSSDIYGHRLVAQFDPSTAIPSLLLDGATKITATGTVPAGRQLTLRLAINHPNIACASLPIPSGCAGGPGPPIDNVRVTPAAGAFYVIGTGWGGAGRGMVEKHRKLLQQNQSSGLSATSEPVLGESLAMIGYTWLAENTRTQQILTEIAGATTTWLHAVGIVGMKTVGTSQGPYVDLPINGLTITQRVNNPNTGTTPIETGVFSTASGVSSILESGSIEQTQPSAAAVSTIKVLDQWSQSGTIFDINDPTISGDDCGYYAGTIRSQLTGYGSSDLARIDGLVGYAPPPGSGCAATPTSNRVITPSSGTIVIDQWPGTGNPGTGYLQVVYDSTRTNVTAIGALITGGLSGGYPASPVPAPVVTSNQAGAVSGTQYVPPSQSAPSVASTTNTNIAAAGGGSSLTQQSGGDPVDLVTGSYLYDHQDLSVGSGPFPDTLSFVRTFDSGLGQSARNSSLLGNGWMHNYDMTALPDSDGFEGMGENSPINGAATIAALYVIQDILNLQTSTAKPTDRVLVAALAERWWMEQLINNVVGVARAGSVERFALLTNGSYNPPLGSVTALSAIPGGGYLSQDAAGATLSFNPASAAAAGRVASWANAAGASVTFTYNGSGQLQSVRNPATLRQLNLHYTGNQLTSVDDGTGVTPRTVSYGYDTQGNLSAFTDPLGQTTRFAYGGIGQLTKIFYPTNPGQPYVSMTYDTLGRPAQQSDAVGNVTGLYFAGTRTEVDDPVGTARVSYFTPRGHTRVSIDGLGSASLSGGAGNQTNSTYDGLDRVLTVTNPEGGITTFAYDAYSNPLSVTRTPKPGSPLAPLVQSFTYTSPVAAQPNFEEPATAIDPLGLVTQFFYDNHGNRVRVVADAGTSAHFNVTSRFGYDGQGRLLSATDPLGTVTQYAYDGLGNLMTVTGDVGRLNQVTTSGYDPVGNRVRLVDPDGNITISTYDVLRRLGTVTLPPAPVPLITSYSYDSDSRLLQTQQSASGQVLRTTSTRYTLTGKPASATDANGSVTRYGYDAADRLNQVTDPVGNVTGLTYDPLGRRYQVFNAAIQASALSQQAYTPDGLLASLTIARSNSVADSTSYAYDGFDRLGTATYPGSSTETYTYDADSNPLTRKTRKGDTITFTYDTLNRLSTKAAPSEATVSYGYDLAGHVTAVNDNSAAIPVPAATASVAQSAGYDALNRPLAISWSPAAAQATPTASSVTFSHTYDRNNRRVGQSATDNSWWSYPTTAGTVAYTPNNLNQYGTIGSVTPTYDGNGNLTYDGSFTYGYDADSRLTSVTQGSTTVATYAYDAQGRRKAKTVGATTTLYVTDADNREVLEYDGTSGAVQRWYSFGPGADAVLNQMNVTAGSRATLIPDIQGSIIGALGSNGTLTKTGYQAFGQNPALASNGFYYTGRRLDPETAGSTAQPSGLYYYRARMYSPTLGRFMQPDPIGYAGGSNFYAYVGNDPFNATDPSGLYFGWDDAAFIAGGALFGIAGQIIHDSAVGKFGTKADYAGAILGGAAGGETLLYAGPIAAGAVAGAVTSVSQDVLNGSSVSYGNLAISTGVGAVTGLLGPVARTEGISIGSNSFNAIYNQIATKAGNGTISSILPQTAGKMFIGRAEDTALMEGTVAGSLATTGAEAVKDDLLK